MNENKIELTQEDYDMTGYILSILKSNPVVLMSWGYHSPVVIKLGLRFKVNGFKHHGVVEVRYNDGLDLFDLTFYNVDGSIRNTMEGIYVDQLVEVIDDQVEKVDNYKERVNQEYNFINDEKDI